MGTELPVPEFRGIGIGVNLVVGMAISNPGGVRSPTLAAGSSLVPMRRIPEEGIVGVDPLLCHAGDESVVGTELVPWLIPDVSAIGVWPT